MFNYSWSIRVALCLLARCFMAKIACLFMWVVVCEHDRGNKMRLVCATWRLHLAACINKNIMPCIGTRQERLGYLPALVSQIRSHQFPCSVNSICTPFMFIKYISLYHWRTLALFDMKLGENQRNFLLEKLLQFWGWLVRGRQRLSVRGMASEKGAVVSSHECSRDLVPSARMMCWEIG